MPDTFLTRIIRRPPVFFPLVALFHIVMLLVTAWQFSEVLDSKEAITAISVWLIYTICWLFICDMKKWAALTYVILSLIGVGLQFLTAKGGLWYDVGTVMFPFNLLMIVFLMFYYKRFE